MDDLESLRRAVVTQQKLLNQISATVAVQFAALASLMAHFPGDREALGRTFESLTEAIRQDDLEDRLGENPHHDRAVSSLLFHLRGDDE